MDARLDPQALLGLEEGDAHVIRNAGGVITDDEIRSLAISQRLLGTEEMTPTTHHTDCGMLTFKDDDSRRQIQDETGVKPTWAAEAFNDLEEDVRQSMARMIKASPFIPRKDKVRFPWTRLRPVVYAKSPEATRRGSIVKSIDGGAAVEMRGSSRVGSRSWCCVEP